MGVAEKEHEVADAQINLRLAQAGDEAAFSRLLTPLRARLVQQATVLSGQTHNAEDLVNETLLEAWKCLSRYNEKCRLSTWLYAILLHRHQKALRRARSRPKCLAWFPLFERQQILNEQTRIPSILPDPADAAIKAEDFSQIRHCLNLLSKKHQNILMLRFFADASLPEMAQILSCPIGTVKSRLHHALEKMRKIKMNLADTKGDKPI